jgi:hypothetical protein
MSDVSISSNAARFNAALGRYMQLTSKLPDEVLEKKGRDLGIRLFRGFRDRQYGGPQRNAGLARRELAQRTAACAGTRVRSSLMREYLTKRAALRSQIASFVGPRNARGELGTIKQRIGLWQSFVGREVGLRQRGIGVLAASFLWYRRRSSQARGTFFVKNRTGRPLGSVEKGDGFLKITSQVPGITEVDERYGVVDRALGEAAVDMMNYVSRKERENYAAAFRSLGGAIA